MPPFLRENAAALGIIGAAGGGLLYVLVSVLANWVYEPAGVTAAEVGLGYGPLLLGTAQALVFVLAAAVVVIGLLAALIWMSRELGAWWWLAIPAAFGVSFLATTTVIYIAGGWLTAGLILTVGIVYGHFASTRWLKVGAGVVALIALAATAGFLRDAANSARIDLREGVANPPGLWTQPWSSRVVTVRDADSLKNVPGLPKCVLYLGEANGTSVFYAASPRNPHTVRLPTSTILTIMVTQDDSSGDFGGPCATSSEQ
jgi:hypothetical protein